MIDIIEHDSFPTGVSPAYELKTSDNERGEDTAIRWAKQLGAKELHCVRGPVMVTWKVRAEEDE